MKIIHLNYREISPVCEKLSLCLGYFDGIHLGHDDLIINAKMLSDNPLGLLTFSKPVSSFIRNDKSIDVLTSNDDKARYLNKYKLDYLFIVDIDQDFIDLSPLDFIKNCLLRLNVTDVFIGEDYRFGALQKGTPELLKNYFNVHVMELIKKNGKKISTQDIINLLKEGKIKDAQSLLGHPYEIMGIIEKGFGRGHKIGFPTANLKLSTNYVLPKLGVYKCIAYVRGVPHIALANVGVHPTVGSLSSPLVEVHIPNFTELNYGMNLYLQFIDFVRPEVKLNSIEELKAQIKEDLKVVEIDFI